MARGRVGIDLVPFSRVRHLVESGTDGALSRMLTGEELLLSRTAAGPDVAGIAGRLAAKEAVFKLLRAPGHTLPWLGIEILKDPGGWPGVRLSGRAARLARNTGIEHIDLSITHDDPFAMAVAYCDQAPAEEAEDRPAHTVARHD